MINFLLLYFFIGSIIAGVFEFILSKSKDLETLGEDFKITNSDMLFTIVLWPVAILYLVFS